MSVVDWKKVVAADVDVEYSSLDTLDGPDEADGDIALLFFPDGTGVDVSGHRETFFVRHFHGEFRNHLETVECSTVADVVSAAKVFFEKSHAPTRSTSRPGAD